MTEHPTDADLRREFLATRDFPCPGCRYNLRGLAGDACPECNQRLEFALRLAEPRLGALLAAILGFAGASAGGGALFVLFVAVSTLQSSWGPRIFFLASGLPALAGTIGLVLVTSRQGRTWFRRSSGAVRRAVVVVAWGTLAAFLIGMTAVALIR